MNDMPLTIKIALIKRTPAEGVEICDLLLVNDAYYGMSKEHRDKLRRCIHGNETQFNTDHIDLPNSVKNITGLTNDAVRKALRLISGTATELGTLERISELLTDKTKSVPISNNAMYLNLFNYNNLVNKLDKSVFNKLKKELANTDLYFNTVESLDALKAFIKTSSPNIDTTDPVVEPVEPVVDPVEPAVEPAVEPVEPAVEPAVDPVDPIVDPVEPAVEPAVDPVEPAVEPAVDPVEPATPVVDPVEPAVDPVEPAIEPVEPAIEPVDPIVQPAVDPVEPVDPIVDITTPVVDPGAEHLTRTRDYGDQLNLAVDAVNSTYNTFFGK
jgi:hypothetical protein